MEKTEGTKSKGIVKLGVIILAVILVISGLSNLFDSGSRKAEKCAKEAYTEFYSSADSLSFKKVKTVAKNKDRNMYAVDVTVRVREYGETNEDHYFAIICNGEFIGDYEYDKSNRREILELVYSRLVRG